MTTNNNLPAHPNPNDYRVPATGNVCWEEFIAAAVAWAESVPAPVAESPAPDDASDQPS